MGQPIWTQAEFKTNTGEDHLVILSVGISIGTNMVPGVNTVTPRARYLSFYSWYDMIF